MTAESIDRQSWAFKVRESVTKNYARHSDHSKISPVKFFDWQAMIETANVMILIFDSKNHLCYANALVKTVTGYTKVELLKNTDLLPQLQFLQEQANLAEYNSNTVSELEVSLLTKKGDQCWLNCSIQTTECNQQSATLLTAIDITKYKQTQERVQQVLEREKEQAYSNAEFASMVSHELRTPLNIISFSSNLLQRHYDYWDKNKKQEYFERIQRGIKTIALLIDEVSIIGKVEAQKLKFKPQKANIQEFCQILLEDLQLANCNEQQINFSGEGDRFASLDKSILQLVLTNLIENAVKYSPQGQVVDFTVTTNLKQITFNIKDRGIGITQSDLQRLFEPFYRGNNVGELPGNGLGLTVVKKLVNLHGGEISVNSQVGVGTEFIVSLPNNS
jgi:PAS domain S-box-containing protein